MNGLFVALLSISLVGLIVGLTNPQWVKMQSRMRVGWVLGSATLLFFVLFVITAPPETNSAPVGTQAATGASQSLQGVVQAAISDHSGALTVSYQSASVDAGEVTIALDVTSSWDASEFMTDTGKLTSAIFQQVFPMDSSYSDVIVRYHAPTTDQYGHSSDNEVVWYDMDRTLYKKIGWSGFPNTGNDANLCAFIREDFNTMSASDQENSPIGCMVALSDLRSAENKIEASSPQYKDIPVPPK